MATYSFPVPPAWFQYFSGSKLGRYQTRPWTQPNEFKCLLDHADDAPLAINSIECFKWSEKPFISWRSGIQHVVMVTKNVSSYCRAPLVEPYRKKSNISEKKWLRYPCLSYLIKILLSEWRHHCLICIFQKLEFLWNQKRYLKTVNSVFILMPATCLCLKIASIWKIWFSS